jgi:hypothetical protein
MCSGIRKGRHAGDQPAVAPPRQLDREMAGDLRGSVGAPRVVCGLQPSVAEEDGDVMDRASDMLATCRRRWSSRYRRRPGSHRLPMVRGVMTQRTDGGRPQHRTACLLTPGRPVTC